MTLHASRGLFERRPLVTQAVLTFEDDTSVICSTIHISGAGVKLVFPRSKALPDNFRVSVAAVRVRDRPCRMLWRNGDELGIRFV